MTCLPIYIRYVVNNAKRKAFKIYYKKININTIKSFA